MNASQQHLLDAYRAARRGEEAPVLPGAGTVRAVRDIREWRRFHAVVTDPADRLPARIRRALRAAATATARLLTGRPTILPTDPTDPTSPLPTGRPTGLLHTGPHPSAPSSPSGASNPAAPSILSAASNSSGEPATSGAPDPATSPRAAHAPQEVVESGAHLSGRPVRCG